MNPSLTWNTTQRVLTQLRRDPRTVAMLLVLPAALTWLLQYIFSEAPVPPTGPVFNTIGPRIMGLFPLILMFLITSITMLRKPGWRDRTRHSPPARSRREPQCG